MNGDHQPGSVIQPGGQNEPTQPAPAVSSPVPQPAPQPVAQPQAYAAPAPVTPVAPQPLQQASIPQPTAPPVAVSENGVQWTASEYVAHHKGAGWFSLFTLAVLVVAAGIYFLTKDIISVVAIVGMAALFGYYAGRKPAVQSYSISDQGVAIGDKVYSFAELKSFSIVHEGAFSNIVFLPMKRFMPFIPMYYAPEQEEAIVEVLSRYLPFEERKQDPIDRLMNKIRF